MDEELATWLALREPADMAARSSALAATVAERLPMHDRVHVLDLATGTGSNIRALVERLPSLQRWLAIDRNAELLARLPSYMGAWSRTRGRLAEPRASGCSIRGGDLDCHIETRQLDLGLLDDPGLFEQQHLITASALLDLVSDSWLRQLAMRCRHAGATALFTMTYDGRSSCAPAEPEDDLVRGWLNQHQGRDKGLGGPAAGPEAADRARRCFAEVGYDTRVEPSDWTLGPEHTALQRQLVAGWARAARETAPDAAPRIEKWEARRLAHLDAGRSRIAVGHVDLAAWLP